MKRAVVLLSGGLDSATVLAIAQSEGFEVYALTVQYGQRHQAELHAARAVASAAGVHELKEASATLDLFGGSALTDDWEVPKDRKEEGIPTTYVPARNTVLLSLALAYAEARGSSDIFCGVNAVDYSGYPDCRPEFVDAFERLANVATKAGVEGNPIRVHAPLIDLTKPEIITLGTRLGVDYGLTHSCYDPGLDGLPCEHCDACLIRIRAFASLGLEDPALIRVHG